MEVEEPNRLERLSVGAALVVVACSRRAADASVCSRSCGEDALIVAVYY